MEVFAGRGYSRWWLGSSVTVTFALRRFDAGRLREALAALALARAQEEAEPLHPYLELWRIDGLLGGRPLAPDDFRSLLDRCFAGREIDLLDRTPLGLVPALGDAAMRSTLDGLERGLGLEPWMKGDGAPEGEVVLGLLGHADVARLAPLFAQVACEDALPEDDERATYARAFAELRRGFAVAAQRGEGLALIARRGI